MPLVECILGFCTPSPWELNCVLFLQPQSVRDDLYSIASPNFESQGDVQWPTASSATKPAEPNKETKKTAPRAAMVRLVTLFPSYSKSILMLCLNSIGERFITLFGPCLLWRHSKALHKRACTTSRFGAPFKILDVQV